MIQLLNHILFGNQLHNSLRAQGKLVGFKVNKKLALACNFGN